MARGPLIQLFDGVTEAAIEHTKDTYNHLVEAQGTVPYWSEDISRAGRAQRWLPVWFVFGQAEDPISVPWWAEVAAQHGPADTAKLDAEMRTAWDDEQLRMDAMAVAGDDVQQQYHWLRAVGLHTGTVRPTAGGKA